MPVLLSYTLDSPTTIIDSVYASFDDSGVDFIVAITISNIRVYQVTDNGFLTLLSDMPMFATLRKVIKVTCAGTNKQFISVSGDSGVFTVLAFSRADLTWTTVISEAYGRSGLRRIVPGEYLSGEPLGRAVIISAVEESTIIYPLLSSGADCELVAKSPCEYRRKGRIVIDQCCVDVGYGEPTFACLEMYHEGLVLEEGEELECLDSTYLKYYVCELGINTIKPLMRIKLPEQANRLIPVYDGNQGVIVCGNDYMAYYAGGTLVNVVRLPRRVGLDESTTTYISSYITHKMDAVTLLLAQNDYGDIFRIDTDPRLTLKYYATTAPAHSLTVVPSGFLFVASTNTNIGLYTCCSLGDTLPVIADEAHADQYKPREATTIYPTRFYANCGPVINSRLLDCIGDRLKSQLYVAQGSGGSGSLRILEQGTLAESLVDSDLPGGCNGVWTLPARFSNPHESYIILSFVNSTTILKVEETIEPHEEPLILSNRATVHVGIMRDSSLIQVTQNGWRNLRLKNPTDPTDDTRELDSWDAPVGRRVVAAASNADQLLIVLNGGSIFYFKFDSVSSSLRLHGDRNFGSEIGAVAIPMSDDEESVQAIAIISGVDMTVKLVALEGPQNAFTPLASFSLPPQTYASSLAVVKRVRASANPASALIGLRNGTLLVVGIDLIAQTFSTVVEKHFLGSKPVKLVPCKMMMSNLVGCPGYESENALLPCIAASSSQVWIYHDAVKNVPLTRLIYHHTANHLANFSSDGQTSGFINISDAKMDIVRVPQFNPYSVFSSVVHPLLYTPRDFVPMPSPSGNLPTPTEPWRLAVIQADISALGAEQAAELKDAIAASPLKTDGIAYSAEDSESPEFLLGYVGKIGKDTSEWGGALSLVDPISGPIQHIGFPPNHAPLSVEILRDPSDQSRALLAVGVAVGLSLTSHVAVEGYIQLYCYNDAGELELLNTTPVDDAPRCMTRFRDGIAVGIGKFLRYYTLGKKRLLKKCEYVHLPTGINWLGNSDKWLYASDIRDGMHALAYDEPANLFTVECTQTMPRWITRAEVLDTHTVAAVDKFGGFFLLRAPASNGATAVNRTLENKIQDERYRLNKTPRFSRVCEYHLGDLGMNVIKGQLSAGSADALLVTTLMGSIIVFLPLRTQLEVNLFTQLQTILRSEVGNYLNRDHIAYRSAMFPVYNVIDGDLLHMFMNLPVETQSRISATLERTPAEIARLLQETRLRVV